MNKKYRILLFLIIFLIPNFVFSNSAEPPYIAIITENKDKIENISLEKKNSYIDLKKEKNIMETNFTLYTREAEGLDNLRFKIKGEDESFFIELKEDSYSYNNIYTLNMKDRTFEDGKSLGRSVKLVLFRLTLTLFIEGFLLFLFGFEEKRTFIVFLLVNLISQGGLNLFINSFRSLDSYRAYIAFIFMEVLILFVEPLIYMFAIDEHSKSRRVAYGVVANLLSLFIGAFVLKLLPI